MPRTVSISAGSPSLRRSAATWTSTVFDEPYQVVCQTSRRMRSRSTTRSGVAREQREQVELLAGQVHLAPATLTRCARRSMDRAATTRVRSSAGSPLRRGTARMRAISSRSPNGFTT